MKVKLQDPIDHLIKDYSIVLEDLKTFSHIKPHLSEGLEKRVRPLRVTVYGLAPKVAEFAHFAASVKGFHTSVTLISKSKVPPAVKNRLHQAGVRVYDGFLVKAVGSTEILLGNGERLKHDLLISSTKWGSWEKSFISLGKGWGFAKVGRFELSRFPGWVLSQSHRAYRSLYNLGKRS